MASGSSGGPGPPGGLGEALGEAHHAFEEAAISAEDVQRFTVAEGLSDVERAQLYITSGEAVQELAVIQNLPGLVRSAGRGAWTAVSRSLSEVAHNLDPEGQVTAAASFATVARERLLPGVDITDVILPLVLAGLGAGPDPAPTSGGGASSAGGASAAPAATHFHGTHATQVAWLACLGDVCSAVEPGTMHSRVLPAVAARCASGGGLSLRDRCMGCELLGAVAPHAGPDDLQRSVLRLAASLCGDTEWQVRHAAAQQLPALAAAVAAKLDGAALAGVLEDVFALLEDEEALVRAAAWRALPAVLDLLPTDLRRARALPLLLAQCRELDSHAEMQRSLAAGFGAFMGRLVPDMEGDAEVNTCLGCFRSLAWRHDHATRLACAAGFAAVLKAGTARRYGSHLHDTLLRLASDGDPEVRLAIAGCLPDVAAVLGKERCCQYLRQPVAALLQDERQEVQAALLARLPEVLGHFIGLAPGANGAAGAAAAGTAAAGVIAAAGLGRPAGAGPLPGSVAAAAAAAAIIAAEELRGKTFAPFVEPLLRLEASSGYSWRLQLALLQAIAAFPGFFSGDQLHDRFLPLALKYMADGAAAVRSAGAAAAVRVWRALRRPAQRTGLYSRIIHDFAQAKCFRQRMVFVDFCRHAQQHFSSKFVKAYLLEPALVLAYDPVANVRLHLAAAMPSLKQAVALPDDVHLLERLNSAMSHLITDGDGDVIAAARKANDEFKRMPVRMSCGALESSPAEVKAFEAADTARAEGERDFLFDPDGLDKIRADIAAYDELLRPSNARLALSLPLGRADSSSSGPSSRGASSRSGRPVGDGPASGAGAAGKARGVAAGVAAAAGHRSASDGPEVQRPRVAAAGAEGAHSVHGRTASAGSLGASGGSKAGGAGLRSTAAARLKAGVGAAARAAGGAGGTGEQRGAGEHAEGGDKGPAASAASRLGRPSPSHAHASSPKSASPGSPPMPKLSRPSPTLAGTARRPAGASPPAKAVSPPAAEAVAAAAAPQQAQQQQQSQAGSLPERLAVAAAQAAASAAAGSRLPGSVGLRAGKPAAGKGLLGSQHAPDTAQLASKFRALHTSTSGGPAAERKPPAAAAGAGGRRVTDDVRGAATGAAPSPASKLRAAVGRLSLQHGSNR